MGERFDASLSQFRAFCRGKEEFLVPSILTVIDQEIYDLFQGERPEIFGLQHAADCLSCLVR